MSYQKLKEKILDIAAEQARELEAQAGERSDGVQKDIMESAQELEERLVQTGEAEGRREARRLIQESQLAAKANVLTAKQAELTALEQVMFEEVKSWGAAEAEKLIAAMLELLPVSSGEVIAGEAHAGIIVSLAKQKGLEVTGTPFPNEGGFLVTYPEGRLDMRLSRVIKQFFTQRRAEIARRLFS